MNDDHPQSASDVPQSATDKEDDRGLFGLQQGRVELISTIILSIAVILTAWSAFQSGKWSGVQAINFSEAGAARTESTRFSTLAGQQAQVDVSLFVEWAAAIAQELKTGDTVIAPGDTYTPVPGTLSNFLFLRMREEFRPAMDAWLATDPIGNADAPKSPFDMPEYVLDAQVQADLLQTDAEEKSAAAREANQTGDTYVLTAVMFATVLFFGGVSAKLVKRRNSYLALIIGILMLFLAGWILLSLPVELGDEFFFLNR